MIEPIKPSALSYYVVGSNVYYTNDKGLCNIRESAISEEFEPTSIPETIQCDEFIRSTDKGHNLEPYLLYLDEENETALGKCSQCGINLFLDFHENVVQWFIYENGEFRNEPLQICQGINIKN